jgi:CMP-N,N'-diacetyllegionaminic acid synthase
VKNIAIIPARSGSKGLIDKNIKLFSGKPLIAYTIEAAKLSGMFDEIFVSTDSKQYADIAEKYGAAVPFLRSKELSSDTASSWDVVNEVLEQYKVLGKEFETIALLQPTSPLRTNEDIVAAYCLFEEKKADSIVSVCEVDHSPLWCNILPEDGSLKNFINQNIKSLPRQSLPKYYRINGALYITRAAVLTSSNDIYQEGCYAYIMPRVKSIDIDDDMDFRIAEMHYSKDGLK